MRCKYLDHQINVRTDGQYRLCCMSLEPENDYNIKTHTPQEWHDSEFHKKTREQMTPVLADVRRAATWAEGN